MYIHIHGYGLEVYFTLAMRDPRAEARVGAWARALPETTLQAWHPWVRGAAGECQVFWQFICRKTNHSLDTPKICMVQILNHYRRWYYALPQVWMPGR